MRLFERDQGGFYTAHDDDAHYVATTVFKTTTVIKQLGGLAHQPLQSPAPLSVLALFAPLASLWHFPFFCALSDGL